VGEALGFLAVDAEHAADVAGESLDVLFQFIFVRVAGIGVEGNDFGADIMRFAEDVDGRLALGDLVAERAFRAITDEQDEILRVADVVLQMVPDAPGFAHARRADDDHRLLAVVQLLGILGAADVGEVAHAEGVFLFMQKFRDALVVTFGVLPVNLRGVYAQRAVHENRHARQAAAQGDLMQHINNLLGAPDGKGRDDDPSPLVERVAHEPADGRVRVGSDGVFASAIGGFNLEIVHVFDRHRVAQDFIAASAHVAAEEPAEFSAFFLKIQNHLRRAENVAGVAECDVHAVQHGEGLFVAVRDELFHGLLGVRNAVERLDGRLMFFCAPFGDEERVLLLNVRGVNEHDAAKVARGISAMDGAIVTLLDEIRQVAGVVNVRVAQDDGVNLVRVEGKAAVAVRGCFAMALIQTTFEQQTFAVDLDEIHGAGGGARRAEEVEFHAPEFNHGWTRMNTDFLNLRIIHGESSTVGRCNDSTTHAVSDVPVGDARLVEVVGRHLDVDRVADVNADEVFAHLAGDVREHLVAVGQCDAEHGAGQHLFHVSHQLDWLFFGHGA